jgi:hypothetical protein
VEKRLERDSPAAVWRMARAGSALLLLALAFSSCISLKENKVVQTTPGKVTIRTVVCASNYGVAKSDCAATNVFATHNNPANADQAKKGQLLVGFRVPMGVIPPARFSTKSPAVSFTRSETYTSELKRLFEPLDQQWIGYISAVVDYKPDGPRVLAMEPEFTLPAASAGAFRWRSVVGFREGAEAAAPVSCPKPPAPNANPCIESPAETRIRTDEVTPISDFGVIGATTTAFPGTTAVVPFKLRYFDGARLGRQLFSFSAGTALPRTNARVAAQTFAPPNSITEVQVQVPVPTGAAGQHEVTLRGAIGSPPVVREAKGTIIVAPLPQQGNKPRPRKAVGNVDFTFRKVGRNGRKVIRMVVTGVPAKGTVAIRCRGRGCAFKSKTVKGRGTLSLTKQFRGRTLRPVTVIMVRIGGPNRIAKEISFKIRKGKKTAATMRCRPPGAKKTLECGK